MAGSKANRLAERIRERVANVVLFELNDPRIGFCTITRVKLAKDLSTCHVFYSVLGTEGDRSKVQHALDAATGFVQREVAKVLHTRVTPRLTFHFDESVEGSIRISALLDKLNQERGESGESDDAGEADEADRDQPSGEHK